MMVRYEDNHWGDDTAVNGLLISCVALDFNYDSHDANTQIMVAKGYFGTWRNWSEYYDNFLICGAQTKIEKGWTGDYTGLNGIRLKFCFAKLPLKEIKGRWQRLLGGTF